ncbi:MAG: phage terminase large subunit family protein [Candidatus Peribacteraceae bacterium]|nr:phage terminase large subunit family protein [Candidatus Peribacteraceae bacterium]
MPDLTEQQICDNMMASDSCFWAVKNKIKLLGGERFTLNGCGYLEDILRDNSRQKVIMKGAQARLTTSFMIDATHGMIYGWYPQGVIYYFPTEKAVEGFSKTRFGPFIADNPVIKRTMKNTNSVSIKRVGNTFLRLLGASATKLIQGKKDGTSVRSEPADYIIRDERDLFDDDMAQQTKQRILNSKIGREVDLGTPTIPDFGISKEFNDSTQKHWMIPCGACNEYTCIVDEFPESIRYKNGNAYFACIKCGNEIFPVNGDWVEKYPGKDVTGWLVSHFLNPNIRLNGVMARWEKDQRDGNIGEFYNSILGLPYIPAEDRLRQQDVFDCCSGDAMCYNSAIPTALGADIGKNAHHVVISQRVSKDRAKIVYMARVKGFPAIHDLAVKFNVKSAVIDLRPYEEKFREFQKAEPYKVFGCEYRDKQRVFAKVDDKSGIYVLNRTEIFDKTHKWVTDGKLEIPRKCEEVKIFAKQMCNCAKVLETNDNGDRMYRYRPLGTKEEHYRNAVNYLYIAMMNLNHYEYQPTSIGSDEHGYDVMGWGL